MSPGILGMPTMTVWLSRDGGATWDRIEIRKSSMVAGWLTEHPTFDDEATGYRYCRHNPEEIPDER